MNILPCSILEFAVIRHNYLNVCSFDALSPRLKKFLYPLEQHDSNSLSLTDGLSYEEQIRYPMKSRAIALSSAIAFIMSKKGSVEIKVPSFSSEQLTNFSATLLRGGRFHLNLMTINDNVAITENEKALLNQIALKDKGDEAIIFDSVRKIINSGDIFTAESILEHCCKCFDGFSIRKSNIIGTVKNCLGKSSEAEYFYNNHDGTLLSQIKSAYPTSMLHLRHHPKIFQDPKVASQLLEQSFKQLQQTEISAVLSSDELDFHRVFNRNGYALILFKDGKVEESVDLLKWGLSVLGEKGGKFHMHKSVILYNIYQCYKQSGDIEKAHEYMDMVLDIDPMFPEYWLEKISITSDSDEKIQYFSKINDIDPYHSDSVYLHSIELLDRNEISQYIAMAKKAWVLDENETTRYNYLYSLTIHDALSNIPQASVSDDNIEDYLIACAEEAYNKHSLDFTAELLKVNIKAVEAHQ
ncbi:tetratricopeptide repeat protein [Vibrio ouci]|uniref:Tetratricopeptide repeat protein n=1 Tax=Vibrio ouci TaxID=2499078 RepID=A0A4Y8WAE7_9VIBR|nr:tetratricopeptide repeat protein [Vibrio ouci]TFH89787.1 tetratricopeptide repeat protein [Vibrio ouci]